MTDPVSLAIDLCSWWPKVQHGVYIGGCCAIHVATSSDWLGFASH